MHGKVWVLDTETKGTGAQMVPLESTLKRPQPKEHFLPATARRHKPAPEPVERAPRRFRVTDYCYLASLRDGHVECAEKAPKSVRNFLHATCKLVEDILGALTVVAPVEEEC